MQGASILENVLSGVAAMPVGTATEELLRDCSLQRATPARSENRTSILSLLLRIEDWFAARASARTLYGLDDRALSDIGLSRADVEGINLRSATLGAASPIEPADPRIC
jgi:uncharacterized protein YjiS (DUF1127 family)